MHDVGGFDEAQFGLGRQALGRHQKGERHGADQLGVQLTQHACPAEARDAIQGKLAFPKLED